MWRRLDFPALPALLWDDGPLPPSSPLVLFLHGIGERGTDGTTALRYGLPNVLAQPRAERMRVVVPQCPPDCRWRDRLEELAALVDTLRDGSLTVTGFSMGGQGAWDFAARYPERVSRLAPVAASLPNAMDAAELARRLPDVPTWVVHGTEDASVAVANSDAVVDALKALGRSPVYSRHDGLGHVETCAVAYADDRLRSWLAKTGVAN